MLIAPTVAGAVLGAYIMRHTPERMFDALVPGLVLGATLVILLQGLIARRSDAAARAEPLRAGAPPRP